MNKQVRLSIEEGKLIKAIRQGNILPQQLMIGLKNSLLRNEFESGSLEEYFKESLLQAIEIYKKL